MCVAGILGTISSLLLVISVKGTQIRCQGLATKSDARDCCLMNQSRLPSVHTENDNYNLQRNLLNANMSSSWIALQKIETQEWTWVDGTQFNKRVEGNGNCAFFNITTRRIIASECSKKRSGYMCMMDNCGSCHDLGYLRFYCTYYKSKCYMLHNAKHSWYMASSACKPKFTLAILSEDAKENIQLINILQDEFWLGLTKNEWISKYNNSITSSKINFWGKGQPREENCAIMLISKEKFWWETVNCNTSQSFLCDSTPVYSNKTSDTILDNTTAFWEQITPKSQNLKMVVGLSMGISGLVAVIIFIVLFTLKKRKPIKRASDREKQMDGSDAKEIVPLGSQEPENVWEALQIVDYNREIDYFSINMENLTKVFRSQEANDPSQPLEILSISGAFRTGKSFMLNYLLRYLEALEAGMVENWLHDQESKLEGFSWSSGTDIKTFGIWVWSKPFQIQYSNGKKATILVLDSQGLFDDQTRCEATTLVTLTSFISSIQIYNAMQELSASDIQHARVLHTARSLILKGSLGKASVPPKRFLLLLRDRKPTKRYPVGVGGGEKYLKKRWNKELLDFSKSFVSCECFLMPEPGRAAMFGNGEYCGEAKSLTKEFKGSLTELAELLFSENKFQPASSKSDGKQGNTVAQKIIVYVCGYNTRDLAKPGSIGKGIAKATNEMKLQNGIEEFCRRLPEVCGKATDISKAVMSLRDKIINAYSLKFVGNDSEREPYKQRLKRYLNICLQRNRRNDFPVDLTQCQEALTAAEHYSKKLKEHISRPRTSCDDPLVRIHQTLVEETVKQMPDGHECKQIFRKLAEQIYQGLFNYKNE